MIDTSKTASRPVVLVIGIVAIVTGITVSFLLLILPDSDERIAFSDEEKTVRTAEIAFESDILDEAASPVGESKEALVPEVFCIKGYVRDQETRDPIPAFDLQINRKVINGTDDKAEFNWDSIIHETVMIDSGYFNYPLHDAGVYSVTVRSSSYKKRLSEEIRLTVRNRTRELDILLDPGYFIRGVVVDDAMGGPIEAARVFPLTSKRPETSAWILRGFEEYGISATTSEIGEFLLKGLDSRAVLLAAVHDRYAESSVEASPGNNVFVEIRMKTGPVIHGKAFDDHGKPVPGLLITVMGDRLPMPRSVLTEQDGGFRTAPLLPGRVFVRASPLFEEKTGRKAPAFTIETRMVTMRDRDEEVIFGPSPGKVIWRGHLYKESGGPVAGGRVEISPASLYDKENYYYRTASRASCDEKGFFEFTKLVPGTYRVKIIFPEKSLQFVWGEIELRKPGLIEKDIHLSGGEIHGIMVDEITGQPIPGIEGVINATRSKPRYMNYSALLDREGRFHFYGLEAGEYQLTSAVEGSLSKSYPYALRENEVVENIRLPVTHGGRLLLGLRAFDSNENNTFSLSVHRLNGGKIDDLFSEGKGKGKGLGKKLIEGMMDRAEWETQIVLAPGVYEAELDFLRFGIVRRTFEIFPGQTTTVEIFRYEMGTAADVFDITAILEYHDGIPLDGAYVLVNEKEGGWESSGKTNSEGRVILKGIRPGTWTLNVWVVDSASKSGIACPDLVFHEGRKPPNPFVVVISTGIIRGKLLDASTGRALGKSVEGWSALLLDMKTRNKITQSYSGQGNSELNLIGIHEGEYQLVITARGYKAYQSEPITLRANQILDLGRIDLEPEAGG